MNNKRTNNMEDPPNSQQKIESGSISATWEGGALGGVGGRKEPRWLTQSCFYTSSGSLSLDHPTSSVWSSDREAAPARPALQPTPKAEPEIFFPQEFELEIWTPEWRLWWPFYWQGFRRGK